MQTRSFRISSIDDSSCKTFTKALTRILKTGVQLSTVSLIVFTGICMSQAGQLDSTFASGGIFETSDTQAFDAVANAIALQSDGKIVVGGEISSLAGILRLTPNGTLDPTFGNGGTTTLNVPTGLGGGVQVIGLAIQTDGKILAGISTVNSDGTESFNLARLNPSGSLDASFGSGGLVTTFPFGQQRSPTVLALQADGKILLAGDGVMARYATDGQLDSTFGSGGVAVLASSSVRAIAIQGNGQILIGSGGPARDSFPPSLQTVSVAGLITRYNPNGSVDTKFGGTGQVACLAPISAILAQSNGMILVAGGITSKLILPPGTNDIGFGLVRYNNTGSLDLTFGKHGVVVTDFGKSAPLGEAFVLGEQLNGEILTAGAAGQQPLGFQPAPSSFALVRYMTTGALDTGFGSGGKVTTSFGSTASISALALQSDGKIVVAGNSGANSQQSFVNNIVVARYLAN